MSFAYNLPLKFLIRKIKWDQWHQVDIFYYKFFQESATEFNIFVSDNSPFLFSQLFMLCLPIWLLNYPLSYLCMSLCLYSRYSSQDIIVLLSHSSLFLFYVNCGIDISFPLFIKPKVLFLRARVIPLIMGQAYPTISIPL